jgi:hypothetical protein
MATKRGRDEDWARARKLCRLSAEDVRKAKELGLNPRKLIGNIPSPSQRWKAPVHIWVRELYRERQEKSLARATRREALRTSASTDAAPPPPVFAPVGREREGFPLGDEGSDPWDMPPSSLEEEIEETSLRLLRQHGNFRRAADYLAHAFAALSFVERVVLFGSVAAPLLKEVPRFNRLRRAGVAVWHECRDLDLAVWVSDRGSLNVLRKAQGHALNELFDDCDIGVAHHQVDVHLVEAGTDRYLGQLCHYGTCPKGKPECRVPGCGQSLFLQQFEGYAFEPARLASLPTVQLFDRGAKVGPPQVGPDDEGPDEGGLDSQDTDDDDLPF